MKEGSASAPFERMELGRGLNGVKLKGGRLFDSGCVMREKRLDSLLFVSGGMRNSDRLLLELADPSPSLRCRISLKLRMLDDDNVVVDDDVVVVAVAVAAAADDDDAVFEGVAEDDRDDVNVGGVLKVVVGGVFKRMDGVWDVLSAGRPMDVGKGVMVFESRIPGTSRRGGDSNKAE